MADTFGSRLRSFRRAQSMTQKQLAALIGAADSSISNWENDQNRPDPDTITLILGALNIEASDLLPSAKRNPSNFPNWIAPLIIGYKKADLPTQKAACAVLGIRHVTPDESQTESEQAVELIEMSIYDDSAAAGSPLPAADSLERISFKKVDVPVDADFGVRICGDSMSPKIQDGDIVWIYQTTELRDGDIGVFMLDDGAVCKRIRLTASNRLQRLESENPEYPPIDGYDLQGFRSVGRVVGIFRG